jgi:hypothetical protein
MLPPSSGSKNKPSKKGGCYPLHVGFLLGLFFDPEDGGEMLTFSGIHGIVFQKTELFMKATFSLESFVPTYHVLQNQDMNFQTNCGLTTSVEVSII